jgi:hypothetical protein
VSALGGSTASAVSAKAFAALERAMEFFAQEVALSDPQTASAAVAVPGEPRGEDINASLGNAEQASRRPAREEGRNDTSSSSARIAAQEEYWSIRFAARCRNASVLQRPVGALG